MEQYTWLEFIFFIIVVLLVYYAIVFFVYYYPYLNKKGTPTGTKEISNESTSILTEPNNASNELNNNPFIKKFDIAEQSQDVEEKNINNSNISNNFNNFDSKDQNVDESSSLNALNSVFSNLPLAVVEDSEEDHEVEPEIDLTDILPETQDLDFVEMEVTEMSEVQLSEHSIEENENFEVPNNTFSLEGDEISDSNLDNTIQEEEANAYLDVEAGQLGFTFDDQFSLPEKEPIKKENKILEPAKKDDSTKEDDSLFDFNN